MPDQDAVVATTADTGSMQDELNAIWDYLLPAFRKKSLPANPAGEAALKAAVDDLVAHPKKKAQ